MDRESSGQSVATPELTVRDVSKSFAGVEALKAVSLGLDRSEILGIIGPNGAGKTTLFDCITGFQQADSGTIVFGDRDITELPPADIVRQGIARTFQNIRMFKGLTPLETVMAACSVSCPRQGPQGRQEPRRGRLGRTGQMRRLKEMAAYYLSLVELDSVAHRRCEELGFLLQRKVELARAAATRPRILILDEPSAGATRTESDQLLEAVRSLHAGEMTILIVEHNVPFIMELAQRLIVMNFGEVVAEGSPSEIRRSTVVQEIYLGTGEPTGARG